MTPVAQQFTSCEHNTKDLPPIEWTKYEGTDTFYRMERIRVDNRTCVGGGWIKTSTDHATISVGQMFLNCSDEGD